MEKSNLHLYHYKMEVQEFLKENHRELYKELKKENRLEKVTEERAKRYLTQMLQSENPEMENEIYHQEMMSF